VTVIDISPRARAMQLADRYKEIELKVLVASPARRLQLLHETAEIALKMRNLGYSLPKLIQKRYETNRLQATKIERKLNS